MEDARVRRRAPIVTTVINNAMSGKHTAAARSGTTRNAVVTSAIDDCRLDGYGKR